MFNSFILNFKNMIMNMLILNILDSGILVEKYGNIEYIG